MAVCKDRDAKAELNRRGQACEVLADTGISHRFEMVRSVSARPPGQRARLLCSRSKQVAVRKDLLGYVLKSSPAHRTQYPATWQWATTFDRARSLPVDRVQLRKLVEHLGIAPSIPVWKTGVYLSTPMLEMRLESRAGVAPA